MNKKINDILDTEGLNYFLFSGVIERSKNKFYSNFLILTRISYFIKAVGSLFYHPPVKELRYHKMEDIQVVSVGVHRLQEFLKQKETSKVLIFGGLNEYNYCLHHKMNFIDISGFYRLIAFLPWKSSLISSMRLLKKFHSFRSILVPNELNRFILFMNADLLPLYRGLIFLLKNKEFSLHVLQHGYYNYINIQGQIEGELATVNYILDEIQKQKLQKTNRFNNSVLINLNKSKVLVNKREIKNKSIIILGEGWHMHDFKIFLIYIKELIKLRIYLIKHGYKVIFRPHPTERMICKLLPITTNTSSLQETFKNYHFYIGFTSSVIKEAKDNGCYGIQVKTGLLQYFENLEDLGYSDKSINIDDLVEYLESLTC